MIRWLDCDAGARPTTKKMALAEVRKALPASTARVTPAERVAMLERRRAHVARRYR